MLLWINKVAGVVNGLQRDTNPQSTPIAPIISDLACALWDGRALCCLVAYVKETPTKTHHHFGLTQGTGGVCDVPPRDGVSAASP